ncbi:MAG: nuclear transport factor 2 family protein [Microscillaceae bacterium]
MHQNTQLIRDFYTHFHQKDYQKMRAVYGEEVVFFDALFTLEGIKEVGAMWQMLCKAAGPDFRVVCTRAEADEHRGWAEWESFYTFSQTGRKVHNRLRASFEFENGKIKFHEDTFNFWRWAAQAFGPLGWLLGGTSFFKNKVRAKVNARLEKFIQQNHEQ